MTDIEALSPLEKMERLAALQDEVLPESSGTRTPWLNLVRKENTLVDYGYVHSVTGQRVETFRGVVCSVTRQRTNWGGRAYDPDDIQAPVCRSRDGKIGLPNVETFDLKNSGLTVAKLTEDTTLSCADCAYKEWPSKEEVAAAKEAKKDKPKRLCNDSHVYAVMADLEGEGNLQPVLFKVKGAGMSASNDYLAQFASMKKQSLQYWTTFALDVRQNGQTYYAVPVLDRGEETDPADYGMLVDFGLSTVEFLTTAPPAADEDTAEAPAKGKASAKEAIPPADEDF